MGPYDPQDVELFSALEFCNEMDEKYGEGNMDAIRQETEWAAW